MINWTLALKEFTKPHVCVGLSVCVSFKIKRLGAGEVAGVGGFVSQAGGGAQTPIPTCTAAHVV